MADETKPGSHISYELCKVIYTDHPLGGKMVESPINLAMSQDRKISIPKSPESMVKDAFLREWKALRCDYYIKQCAYLSRVYGASSIIYGAVGKPTNEPIELSELSKLSLYFNVLDPLNTAGSLVLNQNPNAPDFQKATSISAAGQPYHFSRSVTIMNGTPVYISYTGSGYGYTGRSVYQRAIFPLKSFVTSMIADDEIMTKAAVVIAKIKTQGSITDKITGKLMQLKRNVLKDSRNGNVVNISNEDSVETLNLQNVDKAVSIVRNNIIENIASSATIPPKLLLADGYAGVLSNGTEDYKETIQYINGLRQDMRPLYDFFDKIVQHRAWSAEFYACVQKEFPEEYGSVDYNTAFYDWVNDFVAEFPSLMEESESEKASTDKIKLDAVIQLIGTLAPMLDQQNKGALIEWAQNNINSLKVMFSDPLLIDVNALVNQELPDTEQGGLPPELAKFVGGENE